MKPCAPVFTLAALPSSVSMCMASETRIHAHQHVAENQFAVALDTHAHEGFVAHPVPKGIFRVHVNMP